MKKFCSLLLLLASPIYAIPVHAQSSVKPQYSNVWRPINEQGIRDGIRRNHKNGVGLAQTMTRALLQQKAAEYLTVIKAASDAEPKNGTLLSAYVWALVETKNSYRFNATPMPTNLSQRFNFGDQYILDTLQKSKELSKWNWLAYIVESAMEPGGLIGQLSKGAAASKKALSIQRNALTLTQYGSDLMFQSALIYGQNREESKRQAKEGLRLLLMAQRLYPTYYKVHYEVYSGYGYPVVAEQTKRMAALRRFYGTIPTEYRRSSWVTRYFKYLDLGEPLAKIGITL